MTFLPADRLPDRPDALAARSEARAILDAYRAFLGSPAFQHMIDVAVLTKIAGDDAMPPRERRRAAEMLATFRLKALEALASITGVREQVLQELGIDTSMKAVALTQVNTRIEIIRKDDWRAATAEFVDDAALPDGAEADDEHAPGS